MATLTRRSGPTRGGVKREPPKRGALPRRAPGDERLGAAFAREIYPDHWSFYLGEFALYAFVILVVSGIWLTFNYDASASGAFASVAALSRATPVGYLIRQVHHWSAVTFVAAILIHMARIFFTAAFRKPRELNWVVGTLMLVLASLTGFTGYSLPNDALSGTGLRIADSVLLSIPFAGSWLANVFNGGSYPGPYLLPHLYTFHVYFLPVTIGVLLSLHLGMLIYQKHTQFVPDPEHVVGRRFWPDYALRTIAAFGADGGAIFATCWRRRDQSRSSDTADMRTGSFPIRQSPTGMPASSTGGCALGRASN